MTSKNTLTVRFIAEAVAAHYKVTYLELVSQRRADAVIIPRFVAIWIARFMTPLTLGEIGRQFGGRDHSTVSHAITTIDKLIEADCNLRQEIDALQLAIVAAAGALEEMLARLPADIDPVDLALAVTSRRKSPTNVSANEIVALALAVRAAHDERAEQMPALMALLQNFLAAEDIAVLAAGTDRAAATALKRNHALAALREEFNRMNGDEPHDLAA